MTSSMLTGERRWTSTRRGGMTVLGKVAVPKPINLPSQRLENHGLDPNVEIVPKGTLSWGNKSTSSATNAWGSSSVSPNTESASSSPSHLCGRPSSAGGGTRPSTAGSDRSHEPHGNAWGPSSRPSSASGPVTLNHASLASLRPQSAETKSSSSQLSRFAETSENPVAWNSAVTTEKVGTMPCKSDGFSLTSGDFPTLGSEKECVGKGAESQDNMSNGGATMKEMTGTSAMDDPENVTASVYTLRSDNLPHNDEGSRPNAEKWVGHPQPYPGANIPPPRYDGWHGSPVNNPQGGVWYRGPPQGGPPYRTPVAPGNFPMDPFLYYPQIPPGGLPNPHAPHGTGPRGPHPNTGDIYRPPMHDGFIHPGVSIRPGFYPGPVTYEGYYRPPMGYCNSNDRDAPFMGMPAGPSGPSGPAGPAVYNRHLGLGKSASEPASSHGLSSGHGSSGKALVPEQVESDLPCDNQGPYKVLMQQGNLNGKNEEEENRVNPTTTNQLILEKADQQRASPWENDWDHKKEVDARKRTFGVEPFAQASASHKAQSSENIEGKSCGSMRTGDGLLEKSDAAASGFSEVLKSLAPATKDSSLIQKIEGLNAKARASDVRHDDALISSREESNELQSKDKHSDHFFAHEAGVSTVLPQNRDFNEVIDPASCELSLSTGDRNVKLYSGAPVHRRSNRGMQGRNDHHGRGKVNTQEVEGWHKRPILDSPGMIATPQESSVLARDNSALGAIDKAESFPSDSHGDVPAPSVGDSKDSQAQRTKMRELAKQRTKQLQEEEEERTRKQKARALAKLEELNRRTVAGEGPTQWSENASNDAIRNKIEEPRNVGNPRTIDMISGEHNTVSDLHVVANNSESTMGTNKNSPIVSENTSSKNQSSGNKEKVVAPIESRPIEQDAAQNKNVSEVNGGGASLKHKRTGNKQKPNTPSDKTEKLPHLVKESKSQTVVADIHSVVEESSNVTTDPVAESSTPTRKKHNKSGKNKHKVEEASISTSLPQVSKEATPTTEYDKQTASQSVMNPPSDPQLPINRDDNQFNLQQPLLPVVETHGKGNGQWKSQHSRRMPRNAQNKPGEKIHGGDSVVWAPVRSLNKCEVSIEAVQKNEAEAVASSVKIDNQVQNIPKNKRAEREIYVPKPVAKEMAQQGTFHQDFSPMNQAPDDNKADSSSQSSDNTRSSVAASGMGFSTDHRNGDGRHHKQSKAHASWRQRGATEYGQGLQDQSSYASNAGSYVKKSSEYQVPEKPAGNSTNEFVSQIDEWDPPEGWNDPNYSASIPPVTAVLGRDQGVTGRGKRSQFKGHKGIGNNYDLNERKLRSGDHEKISSESSMPEVDQKDASAAAKESRGVGERSTSHWQPKSRMVQPHNHQSSKARGDQNVDADAAQTNKTGSSLSAHGTKTSDGVAQNHEEGASVGHHGFGGDKKISSRKDRPYSPTQGPIHNAEVAPANSDVRRQQQLPSFYHKGNEINNRFGRGSESRRERNSFQYHKQQQNFPPANRNRQRQNLQYEYQPVGPHNGKPNMDRPKDNTTQHSGSRYIERGQGQSRRDGGNFYKQEGGGPV